MNDIQISLEVIILSLRLISKQNDLLVKNKNNYMFQ